MMAVAWERIYHVHVPRFRAVKQTKQTVSNDKIKEK